jgi:hypothetical protein
MQESKWDVWQAHKAKLFTLKRTWRSMLHNEVAGGFTFALARLLPFFRSPLEHRRVPSADFVGMGEGDHHRRHPLRQTPDFLSRAPGIISLIPGAAVAGVSQASACAARKGAERSVPCGRARRCQGRAEDERRSGADGLIPGEPEHLCSDGVFRLTGSRNIVEKYAVT